MSETNGHAKPKLTLQERRDRAETRLTNARAKLLESFFDEDGFSGMDVQFDRMRDPDGTRWVPVNVVTDRKAGANWPFWRTEIELDRLRQISRAVTKANGYGIGTLKNLVNHGIAKGYSYNAIPNPKAKKLTDGDPDTPGVQPSPQVKALVDATQDVIDEFLQSNRWNCAADPWSDSSLGETREQEAYARVHQDGECLIRFYFVDEGRTLVRFVEPEQLRNPANGTIQSGWSYGIKHRVEPYEDVEEIEEYHVRYTNPGLGNEEQHQEPLGECVPAAEIVHIKNVGTPSTVKRGTPSFVYAVAEALIRADKLQRNISLGATYRAATGEIWQHDYGTQAQISSLAQGLAAYSQTNQQTGVTDYTERLKAPAIRRIPKGQAPVPLPASTGVAEHLQALQGDLRLVAAAFTAPEYLTSADASNGNYASTREAGTPFVRNAESEQERFKAAFKRCVCKAIRWAVEVNRLPREVLTLVDVQVEATAILARNEMEITQKNQILNSSGVKSKTTWQLEEGLEPDKEAANFAKEKEEGGDQGGGLPLPDDGGDMPPGGDDGQALESRRPRRKRGRPVRESKDSSGHEHAADGKFGSGGTKKTDEPEDEEEDEDDDEETDDEDDEDDGPDESAQDNLNAIKENPSIYSHVDLNDANNDLAKERSDYQVVPDSEEGFKLRTHADIEDDYGSGAEWYRDPLTGKPDFAGEEYVSDMWDGFAEGGEAYDRLTAAFDKQIEAGTLEPEDLDAANEQLESHGSEMRIGIGSDGLTMPYSVEDLDDDFPDGFKIDRDPETKKLVMRDLGESRRPRMWDDGKRRWLLEGFTGTVIAKNGAKLHYRDGKRVSAGVKDGVKVEMPTTAAHDKAHAAHAKAQADHKAGLKAQTQAKKLLGDHEKRLAKADAALAKAQAAFKTAKGPAKLKAKAALDKAKAARKDVAGEHKTASKLAAHHDKAVDKSGKTLDKTKAKAEGESDKLAGKAEKKAGKAPARPGPAKKPAPAAKKKEEPEGEHPKLTAAKNTLAAMRNKMISDDYNTFSDDQEIASSLAMLRPKDRKQLADSLGLGEHANDVIALKNRVVDAFEKQADARRPVPEFKGLNYDQKNADDPVAKKIAGDTETRAILEGFAKDTNHIQAEVMRHKAAKAESDKHWAAFQATEAKYGAGSPETLAARKEWVPHHRKTDRIKARLDMASKDVREKLIAAVKPAKPAEVLVAFGGERKLSDGYVLNKEFRPTPAEVQSIKEGLDFVKSVTGSAKVKATLIDTPDPRAHYRHDDGDAKINPGYSHNGGGYNSGTIVHEYGHGVECQKPGLLKASHDFIKYRCGNEKPTDMKDFGMPGEMGRKDNFDRAFDGEKAYYVGKDYGDKATEVISMGIEKLYNDPVGFVHNDPEYAHFVIASLRS